MKRSAALAIAALLAGCAVPSTQHPEQGAAHRIVSLMPSLTEDLCAIGAGKQLVGVSQFSSDIPCAHGLPQVNNATSIDAEKIVALHPDAVVGIPPERLLVAPLIRTGLRVYLWPDDSYGELFANIAHLGRLSGRSAQAERLIASLRDKTGQLQRSEQYVRRPSVFVVLQVAPIWTAGPESYIATLIRLAGGRSAVTALPQAYAQYSAEALLRLQPDVLIASADSQLEQFLDREPWRSLRAVREGHVFVLPDPSAFYRPGPRYNEALAWLIRRLRPLAQPRSHAASATSNDRRSTAAEESPASAPFD